MKLIIRNGENISLTESLGIAYEFIGNYGLNTIINYCEEDKNGICGVYVKPELYSKVFYSAKLNKESLTISVCRNYNN